MRSDHEQAFRDLYSRRAPALRRTAFLLCGDWQQAEDLVQTAFIKSFAAWHRIRDAGAAEAYVRKVLTREFVSDGRRHWARQRAAVPQTLETAEPDRPHEDRLVLLDALRRIPLRQRACLVLRFWEDYSVEDTARMLGCQKGTVKSQTARGLQALRRVLEETSEGERSPSTAASHGVGGWITTSVDVRGRS